MSSVQALVADSPIGDAGLTGLWTYRSWRNEPVIAAGDSESRASALRRSLFLEAAIELSTVEEEVKGRLIFDPENFLELRGAAEFGDVVSLRFQGVGRIGEDKELLIYDYVGWIVPPWPSALAAEKVMVGSVIRTIAHSSGQAKAGYVASFFAVKHP